MSPAGEQKVIHTPNGQGETIELVIAPNRWVYLRQNWLTALALLLPAFRTLRVLRAFRLLRWARAARSLNLVRLLTSLNRGLGATRHVLVQGGLGYVLTVTLLVLLGGAAGMLSFESPQALRESSFEELANQDAGMNSYREALWWTAMILTTMGTDYWPRTPEGRLLCLVVAVYAFAIFGYITATIASFLLGKGQTTKESPGADQAVRASDLAALRQEVAALCLLLEARPGHPSLRLSGQIPITRVVSGRFDRSRARRQPFSQLPERPASGLPAETIGR